MSKLKIEIASVPDRGKLVAEIWFDQSLIAEVNQDNDGLQMEFYLTQTKAFNLDDFIGVLEGAKTKLLN